MANKTEGVRILVQDVLRTISKPYTEDIILNVFKKLEKGDWRRRYDLLIDELGMYGINPWIGKYTKELTGLNNLRIASAPKGSLIKTYTKLGH
jgi:hypothetical protein